MLPFGVIEAVTRRWRRARAPYPARTPPCPGV